MNKNKAIRCGLVLTGIYERSKEFAQSQLKEITNESYTAYYLIKIPDSPLSRGYAGVGYLFRVEE